MSRRMWRVHEVSRIVFEAMRIERNMRAARWGRKMGMPEEFVDRCDEEARQARQGLIDCGLDEYVIDRLVPGQKKERPPAADCMAPLSLAH